MKRSLLFGSIVTVIALLCIWLVQQSSQQQHTDALGVSNSNIQNNSIGVSSESISVTPQTIYYVPPKKNSVLAQTHERKKTLPPQPVVSGPTCIPDDYSGAGITIDGGNVNPLIQYADISVDNNFSEIFRRDMTGSISVAGIKGFMLYPGNSKQLLLQPNTSYYIRFFNGLPNTNGYGPTAIFSFTKCS